MIPLSVLLSALSANPKLSENLEVNQCFQFLELVQLLKPTILISQPADEIGPPRNLPHNVHNFLSACFSLEHEETKLVWRALRDIGWNLEADSEDFHSFGRRYLQLFLDYGYSNGLTFHHFLPPTRVCLDPACEKLPRGAGPKAKLRPMALTETLEISVTVFTRDFGPVPGRSSSTYCRSCNARYYHNYYVHTNATTRTYYKGPFQFIQVAEHVFFQSSMFEFFTSLMLNSWTSATNCARVYNDSYVNNPLACSLPAVYSKSLIMDVQDVWDGLLLYWLLDDLSEHGKILQLPHNARSQAERLRPALRTRNIRMEGPGQPAWNHACDLCCWIETLPNNMRNYLRSTVTDGVAIGRPCCAIHDCKNPLKSVKDRYCPQHKDQDSICVIVDCSSLAETGYRTCTLSKHREIENYNNLRNKSMFQLKHRLARLKTSQTRDSFAAETVDNESTDLEPAQGCTEFLDEEVEISEYGSICDGKPDTGNAKLRARFGRKRTHNEQLCVASCGVILGRATFYGSEAPNGVHMFWMGLFPTKNSLPGVLWHDNNCRIRLMLQNDEDPRLRHYFDDCILPVDVFHFNCKHKESDTECNENCNPFAFPDLRTPPPNERWRFNSSAAEQANSWIGGYQAIVREMQGDRYDFFLDEMIRRRNQKTINDLQQKGKCPWSIPRKDLLRQDSFSR